MTALLEELRKIWTYQQALGLGRFLTDRVLCVQFNDTYEGFCGKSEALWNGAQKSIGLSPLPTTAECAVASADVEIADRNGEGQARDRALNT
jgi:hypothetical protein